MLATLSMDSSVERSVEAAMEHLAEASLEYSAEKQLLLFTYISHDEYNFPKYTVL